uniref:WD repeat domain phosphoinositide-interacting protein 2 n=1 Tax=Strigamia maritima TaxID=126957 RepID=T1IJY8_STRMM
MDESSNLGTVFYTTCNQDSTSLAVGTNVGYKLFSLKSVHKLSKIYEQNDNEAIEIVEQYYSSYLVVRVYSSSPNTLSCWNYDKKSEMCKYIYRSKILAVKMNRMRIVTSLEGTFWIHQFSNFLQPKPFSYNPTWNPQGLFALSNNTEKSYLAYPASNTTGEIQIFDTVNMCPELWITAHETPIAALIFNSSGNMLATASTKGTRIRVFDVENGKKLFEFIRGLKRYVSISSMTFSENSQFLCVSSETETVHVFKLSNPSENTEQGWLSYLGIGEQYSPGCFLYSRAFAIARLPNAGAKTICTITSIQHILYILVASTNGYLYIYNLEPNTGGECRFFKQYRIDGMFYLSVPRSTISLRKLGCDDIINHYYYCVQYNNKEYSAWGSFLTRHGYGK